MLVAVCWIPLLKQYSRLMLRSRFLFLLLQIFPTFPGLHGLKNKASAPVLPKQAKSRWAEAGSRRVMRSLGRQTEDHSRGAAWRNSMDDMGPGRDVHTLALI